MPSYVAHNFAYIFYKSKYLAYLTYVPNLVGIFAYNTYMVIICKVNIVDACIWHMYTKIWGLYDHLA